MTWAFEQIEPQAARGTLKESMWEDPQWIAEEKYDGDRRVAQFCGHLVRFTGRRVGTAGLFVEKTENVPHLSNTSGDLGAGAKYAPPKALDGTVLDGEMIFTGEASAGGKSKYVTSIMGSLPEEAVRKQIERGWLRYVVFDCLFYKGKDVQQLPLHFRKGYAGMAVNEWKNPFVTLAETYSPDMKRDALAHILARGGEGVILKHAGHKYGDKKLWVKVKGEWTADVVIMGTVAAKAESKKVSGKKSITKYAAAGLIGAIQCGQYRYGDFRTAPEEVATVSGMDDELRAAITARPNIFIGRVIEIAHNGREPTGRFRHPRFKRLRTDKGAADCVYREGEV